VNLRDETWPTTVRFTTDNTASSNKRSVFQMSEVAFWSSSYRAVANIPGPRRPFQERERYKHSFGVIVILMSFPSATFILRQRKDLVHEKFRRPSERVKEGHRRHQLEDKAIEAPGG
jgi:hypothetical protein